MSLHVDSYNKEVSEDESVKPSQSENPAFLNPRQYRPKSLYADFHLGKSLDEHSHHDFSPKHFSSISNRFQENCSPVKDRPLNKSQSDSDQLPAVYDSDRDTLPKESQSDIDHSPNIESKSVSDQCHMESKSNNDALLKESQAIGGELSDETLQITKPKTAQVQEISSKHIVKSRSPNISKSVDGDSSTRHKMEPRVSMVTDALRKRQSGMTRAKTVDDTSSSRPQGAFVSRAKIIFETKK